MTISSIKGVRSVLEVMDLLGIGKTSVYREIKKGNLVAKKYGSRTLITEESIESFINSLPSNDQVEGK